MADGDLIGLPVPADAPFPLGRHVNHDPANRLFRAVAAPRTLTLPDHDIRWTRRGTKLNQARIGGCVGFACRHMQNTEPYRSHYAALGLTCKRDPDGFWLYDWSTHHDPFVGEWNYNGDLTKSTGQDTGTDAVSACKQLMARGEIVGYEWLFGVIDLAVGITHGPVAQGTEWLEDMFYPDRDGRVHLTGVLAGGHETETVGFEHRRTPSKCRWWHLNQWGTPEAPWGVGDGVGDYFYTTQEDHMQLIDARNGDLVRFKFW